MSAEAMIAAFFLGLKGNSTLATTINKRLAAIISVVVIKARFLRSA